VKVSSGWRPDPEPLRGPRLRLLAVALPAVLAGSFEFVRHGLLERTGLAEPVGNLITAGLALLGGLLYFQTVSAYVGRIAAESARQRAERRVLLERQAIADELHDSLSQALFFLHVRLKKILERAPAGMPEHLAADLAEAVSTTEATPSPACTQPGPRPPAPCRRRCRWYALWPARWPGPACGS
jgi:hypothetical protein